MVFAEQTPLGWERLRQSCLTHISYLLANIPSLPGAPCTRRPSPPPSGAAGAEGMGEPRGRRAAGFLGEPPARVGTLGRGAPQSLPWVWEDPQLLI